jgi:hypothetical protein
MKGNIVLESKWIKFDNSIKVFKIPFKASYGDGVNVHFTFMKDEKLFTRELSITKKEVKKELKPKSRFSAINASGCARNMDGDYSESR